MRKKLVTGLLLLLATASGIQAADYQTDVTGEYTIVPGSSPKVELDYTLTNTNAAVFVQNYQVVLPGTATSIVVQQKDQEIEKDQHADHDRQILDLTFTNEVVGQGKKREFTIEYADPALNQTRGGSQLIRIPALAGSDSFDTYKTIVRLPTSLGTPDMISPEPVKTGTGSGQLVYTFDQKDGTTINIGYGQEQVWQFERSVTLVNRSNSPAYQEVIFPGDRDDVQFIYSSLAPEPSTWRARDDGSWQGIYLLGIGEALPVKASGYVVYGRIDRDFRLSDFYPYLDRQLQIWELPQSPEHLHDATFSATITGQVRRLGWLPILDQYQFDVRNHTGSTRPGMTLQLAVDRGHVTLSPETADLTLYPWQKSVIISKIRGPWWQPYTTFVVTARLVDAQGEIIDEQKINGLSLSYLALACLGGLGGAAGVAGSLLVDGRAGSGNLRRQGKKPEKSA